MMCVFEFVVYVLTENVLYFVYQFMDRTITLHLHQKQHPSY